ncbi:Fe-S-containing protein [Johnsonella ignava]|uniref:Fe-S-containing protein n=1 Tax=Johnsonella ignava TaxID=43995 RepID=UPI0023F17C9D|nr:Fe-S-containing protein [Johnsonella ignava]
MGIVFAYYRPEEERKRYILTALSIGLGIVAAVVSAIVRSLPNFINRANLSYYSMIPVLIAMAVILLLILFRGILKKKNGALYDNLLFAALALYGVSSFFYYLPTVILRSDGFVSYGEKALSTMVLYRVIGYTTGFTVIILSGLAIYNTGIRLKENQLKALVITTLLIRGVTQMAVIAQRLYSLRILPKNITLFKLITETLNRTRYFDYAVMAVLIIAPIILWSQNIKVVQPYSNRAQLRKIKFYMRNKRHWAQFFIVLIVVNIMSLTVVKAHVNREIPLSPPENYTVEDGFAVITLESVDDGHLHRYVYTAADKKEVRFIIIKKAQGSYGVGLDACELCGPSGYFERKDEVVCKLCDVVMNKGTIGFKGGCNPIPVKYIVHDRKIKIALSDLDALSYVFKN